MRSFANHRSLKFHCAQFSAESIHSAVFGLTVVLIVILLFTGWPIGRELSTFTYRVISDCLEADNSQLYCEHYSNKTSAIGAALLTGSYLVTVATIIWSTTVPFTASHSEDRQHITRTIKAYASLAVVLVLATVLVWAMVLHFQPFMTHGTANHILM